MFADQITKRISTTNSLLCAGFDPTFASLPAFALSEASKEPHQEGFLYKVLMETFSAALEGITPLVACVKPNAAFFEQFGVGGYRALRDISALCRRAGVPVILDAKRGDIASSALAYANAYLEPHTIRGEPVEVVYADALTINPFLGFDTLTPFIESCSSQGKGVFILVKTSNPGSRDVQDYPLTEPPIGGDTPHQHDNNLDSISMRIAREVARLGEQLIGDSGLSSVGAVIGATHPHEAMLLRTLMPRAIFLVPGFGAQGGSAEQATAGLISSRSGTLVNMSRGLFHLDSQLSRLDWIEQLTKRATDANRQLVVAADRRHQERSV